MSELPIDFASINAGAATEEKPIQACQRRTYKSSFLLQIDSQGADVQPRLALSSNLVTLHHCKCRMPLILHQELLPLLFRFCIWISDRFYINQRWPSPHNESILFFYKVRLYSFSCYILSSCFVVHRFFTYFTST